MPRNNYTNPIDNLPEKLKYLRAKQGFTQIQMSELLGLNSISTYASYEEGRAEPSLFTLKCIADIHGCSIDYLVDRNKDEPDESKMFMARFTEADPAIRKCVKKLLDM